MPQIDDRTREHIAAFLPDAVEKAINSYLKFAKKGVKTNEDDETEPSDFKSHHDACKVAIAHIELLLKLAQWADIPEEDLGQGELTKVIQTINTDLGRKNNE